MKQAWKEHMAIKQQMTRRHRSAKLVSNALLTSSKTSAHTLANHIMPIIDWERNFWALLIPRT